MKIFTGILIALSIITACKKGTNDSSGKGKSTVVASMHVSDPESHIYIIDSFERDANNRLTKLIIYSVDSNSLTPIKNTGGYTFLKGSITLNYPNS